MNFISEFHIFFHSWAFVSQLRLSSEELGNCLQTPTLIGCIFLMISSSFNTTFSLHCDQRSLELWHAFKAAVKKFETFTFSLPLTGSGKKNAQSRDWAFHCNSLTMTYFHTGIRTIIGAEAFHCPVRDGKEWYHLAMVVRHNFLPPWHRVKTTNL